jgi:Polyketide cyclase / dehydrase and lipid transport
MGDADSPTAGARFRGRNRRGGFRWSRVNEVVLADRPHTLVWRTVPRFPYPDTVEWRLSLDESGSGTQVSESFQVRSIPRIMEWAVGLAVPAHRDRTNDLADDLARLKAVVEESGDDGT